MNSLVPLSELVTRVRGGGTPSRAVSAYWNGPIPWASVKDLTKQTFEMGDTVEHISSRGLASSSASLIPAGTPIISTRMAVGKAAIPVVDIAINQDLKALYPASHVDPRYLTRILQFIEPKVEAVSVGSTVRGVSVGQLLKFQVFAPPLPEQRYIADILDAADDQICATEQVIAKLRLTRIGLVNNLLTWGISAASRPHESWSKPCGLNSSMNYPIPHGWSVGSVYEWCDRMTVGVVNSATHAYVDSGIPFIRSQNVKPGYIDLRGVLHITKEYNAQQSSSILREGDVVVVRTGYPGTAAVVPKELSGANCFSLLVVTPRKSVLIPEYLALYLNSEFCRRQIDQLHFGSAQHNLNLAELKRLPLPVPSSAEQTEIVETVVSADNLISAEQSAVDKLHLLKATLSTALLSGHVRIPKDAIS
ncbi:restriction endonuclease subunit S [Nocardia gamkensis]|uniref:restriction endonuclease subunit S n=1 Tax=Nocardia gamkensis TaxID=352869 RepID=UPI0033E94CD9